MALALPQPPRWMAPAGAAVWLACMAAAAAIPEDSFWLRWMEELVGALGTVAAGVALASGLVEAWRHRQWRRRTQWFVFEHVMWARRNLAWLVADIFDLTYGPMRFPYGVSQPQDLVALPVTPKQEEILALEVRELRQRLAEPVSSDDFSSRDPQAVVDRLQAAAPDLNVRVESIWQSVSELSDYVSSEVAEQLLKNALWLRGKVTDAWDPMPGVNVPGEVLSLMGAIEWPEALSRCGALAKALSEPYHQLDRETKAPDLRAKLDRLDTERLAADDRLEAGLERYQAQLEARATAARIRHDAAAFKRQIQDLVKVLREEESATDEDPTGGSSQSTV